MDNETRAEQVIEAYDEAVAGIPLVDAIDICETVIADLEARLAGLRDDAKRAGME